MSIPINGEGVFGGWLDNVYQEAKASMPPPDEIVVVSGRISCPKYNTEIFASECTACNDCISPVARNDDRGEYIVRCAYKQQLEDMRKEASDVERPEANDDTEEEDFSNYDWEAEKIAEIEAILSTKISKDDWEQVRPAAKLTPPNTMNAHLLGASSVVKIPSSYATEGLGDRNRVSLNQVGLFEDADDFEARISQLEEGKKRVRKDVQERRAKIDKERSSWERKRLESLNEMLEKGKDLSSIKRIAIEEYKPRNAEVPTGRMGLFDNEPNVIDNGSRESRSARRTEEWEKKQAAIANMQREVDANRINSRASYEVAADTRFEHGKDRTSIFAPDALDGLKEEPDTKEIIAKQREEIKKQLGVREAKERDRSWEDREAQRAQSLQDKAMNSDVINEFLSQIAKREPNAMETFLHDAAKHTSPSEGGAIRRKF